jgi:GT2 family glycosyltransferase
MSDPTTSIVIVNYNGLRVIVPCLDSLHQHLPISDVEIIVVDNASSDGSRDRITQQFPAVKLIQLNKNRGFGAANNVGVQAARGEFLWLLNSDTLLTTNVLPVLQAKLIDHPDVGIVGPKLLNPDGSFQLSVAYEIGLWGEFKTLQLVKRYRVADNRPALSQRYSVDQYVDIVVGAAMFMRRSLFATIGGFDETFFMYFEESDVCQRVRELGYKILYTPEASLIHIGGYSIAQAAGAMAQAYRRSQRYYYHKHRPIWEQWILDRYLRFKQWRQARRGHSQQSAL